MWPAGGIRQGWPECGQQPQQLQAARNSPTWLDIVRGDRAFRLLDYGTFYAPLMMVGRHDRHVAKGYIRARPSNSSAPLARCTQELVLFRHPGEELE